MTQLAPRKRTRLRRGAGVVAGLLGLALLVPGAASAQGTEHEVSIESTGFEPATITIEVGDTVTWTNNDETTPQGAPWLGARGVGTEILGLCELVLAAPGGGFPGESGSCTFEEEGTYAYSDFFNEDEETRFEGVVIVQEAGEETPTTEPTGTATQPPAGTATEEPTETATEEPTETATEAPTATATAEPSPTATAPAEPTATPTTEPTEAPTATATAVPPTATEPPPSPTVVVPSPPSTGAGLSQGGSGSGAAIALIAGLVLVLSAGAIGTQRLRHRASVND